MAIGEEKLMTDETDRKPTGVTRRAALTTAATAIAAAPALAQTAAPACTPNCRIGPTPQEKGPPV